MKMIVAKEDIKILSGILSFILRVIGCRAWNFYGVMKNASITTSTKKKDFLIVLSFI